MEKFISKAEANSSDAISDSSENSIKFNFTAFANPRLKNGYKQLRFAIDQVSKIKENGWKDSDFIIIKRNNLFVIGFDTELFRNSDDFTESLIRWQSVSKYIGIDVSPNGDLYCKINDSSICQINEDGTACEITDKINYNFKVDENGNIINYK